MVQRVRRGSISSELLVCGGGVRSILLLPLVARCLETIDVCIWRMFVVTSVVVIVWGSVGMFVVQRPLLKIALQTTQNAELVKKSNMIHAGYTHSTYTTKQTYYHSKNT